MVLERGVKEKDANVVSLKVVKDGVVPSVTVVSGNTHVENIGQVSTGPSLPTVVDLMMEKDKLSSLEDTTIPESFPPLSTPVTTVDNALGKSSYANITSKPSGKKANIRTLFTPGGNEIDVVVPVDSIRAISERFANTAYGFFLGKKVVKLHGVPVTAFSEDGLSAIATKLGTPLMLDSYTSDMCMQSWGRSSYARVMIELRADVELKDNIVVGLGFEGKLRLLDNDGNPLVPTGIMESDSEVEVVFDETANLRISTSSKDGSDKGYGTNSLLEQWRDSYPDNDDYDPYDDDMYENHDLSEHLQSICDNLDITVRGRKKK
ncbi:hypothetical protein Tco_0278086 [Tanacetum coccineum]